MERKARMSPEQLDTLKKYIIKYFKKHELKEDFIPVESRSKKLKKLKFNLMTHNFIHIIQTLMKFG